MTKETQRGKRRTTTAPAPVWEKRSFKARTLGSILPTVTQPAMRRNNGAAVRLLLDWPDIVGPALARETVPRRLSAGTLTVACSGPVAMELQHLAPQLIERINAHCGPNRTGPLFAQEQALVVRLKILQDATVAQPARPSPQAPPAPVTLPDMADGPLRDVLARLGGHVRHRRASARNKI